jgi:hypothetical protein
MQMLTFYLMDKFDIFHFKSGAMVATREHDDFSKPSAAMATGVIETKALQAALASSASAAEELARRSGPGAAAARLERLSQAMMARKSLTPVSMLSGGKAQRLEAMQDVDDIEELAKQSSGQDPALAPHLMRVSTAAANLRRVSQAVNQQELARRSAVGRASPASVGDDEKKAAV